MRLYYGRILRGTAFIRGYDDLPAIFRFQLIADNRMLGVYDAPTPEGIIEQLKADGHQIWGSDPLDYAIPPRTAFEYLIIKELLTLRGGTEAEIEEILNT